ncbi:MAG: hypothetical protein RLZZ46_766, partial [Bacteroidota bacterium]
NQIRDNYANCYEKTCFKSMIQTVLNNKKKHGAKHKA